LLRVFFSSFAEERVEHRTLFATSQFAAYKNRLEKSAVWPLRTWDVVVVIAVTAAASLLLPKGGEKRQTHRKPVS